MTDSLLRRAMPRGFRPQFSLASAFIFMTASAVATWYWYQRPFPVERMVVSLDPICMVGVMEPAPKNFRQVHYVHRVWGGKTIEHGPYRGYDSQGNLLHVGAFRNGQEHGDFILYNPAGRKIAHWKYVHGVLQGVNQRWDDSGNLQFSDTYVHGKREGLSRCWDSDGNREQEEHYENDVLHGAFIYRRAGDRFVEGSFEQGVASGRWTWFPCGRDGGTIRGQWNKGLADGRWEWTNSVGQKYLTVGFTRGHVQWCEPDILSPRILEAVVSEAADNAWRLASAFAPLTPFYPDTSLPDVSLHIAQLLPGWPKFDGSGMKMTKLPGWPIPPEMQGDPLLILFAKILRAHGLGYDLRFGTLAIDTLQSIARWRDPSGVIYLDAPSGSHLAGQWSQSVQVGFDGMPLQDLLNYLSACHGVQIDMSRIPEAAGGEETTVALDTPVTMALGQHTLQDALALILGQLNCKASLCGETIVVEPQ